MAHADAVTQITADDKARIVLLNGGNGLKATTAVSAILRNGSTVARDMDKVRLSLCRKLQHAVQAIRYNAVYFFITLIQHFRMLDATQEERKEYSALWCTSGETRRGEQDA